MPKIEKQITKTECSQNMKIIMLGFEKELMSSVSTITEKFNESLGGIKEKFAKKEDLKDLKEVVSGIKDLNEKRQYDWLKYAIITAMSIMLSIYFKN